MEQPPPYSPDGQNPPQHGYASPPNTGYPPQPAQYPQQQPGYPPQQPGYPPQQPGYPPQQPGYPPQQPQKEYGGGYPPQNPGYPPQGQGYCQQPAGFSSHSSNTTVVVQNNQPQVVAGVIPVVNDQMGLSIFACFFCCCPIGIFAIMKSSEARNLYTAGDYAGAVAAAQTARNLSYAAIICGLIIYPLIIVLRVVVFAATADNSYN